MTRKYFFLILIPILIIFFSLTNEQVRYLYYKVINYIEEEILEGKDLEIFEKINLDKRVNNSGLLRIDKKRSLDDNVLSVDLIIKYTNEYRQNNQLPALLENSKLILSADKKATDILDNQYFEHVSPSGIGVEDLGNEFKYDYILIGENLALGNFGDSRELVDAWMESPGHRANILNANYTETGVSVLSGLFEGEKVWVAVVHFGTPKSVCPQVEENLLVEIEREDNVLDVLEEEISASQAQIDEMAKGELFNNKERKELIDLYNQKVSEYNNLLEELKNKINKYNKQINLFNVCLESKL
ncbi:MAG TPA: CAP domain-containing protein [Candidatus Paceibacterota bacterium]|jgi:hypothetical protein|nr:CAP domain-containing protein [Candidatus Paceibacterota bacterium]